jgi:hypothetical protein
VLRILFGQCMHNETPISISQWLKMVLYYPFLACRRTIKTLCTVLQYTDILSIGYKFIGILSIFCRCKGGWKCSDSCRCGFQLTPGCGESGRKRGCYGRYFLSYLMLLLLLLFHSLEISGRFTSPNLAIMQLPQLWALT